MKALALLLATVFGLAAPTPVEYLGSRQVEGGGFAEPGSQPTPGLTAWAVIGLRAAGSSGQALADAGTYLEGSGERLGSATDLELVLVARAALGHKPADLIGRVKALEQPSGAIGPTVNSTIWGLLALRAVGERASPATVRYLLRRQHRSGGWSWIQGGAPDSNDTAAAIQALRAAGVRGAPIRRALGYVRRHANPDGGFELTEGRGSDVQSTAWALQAFLAAGERPPAPARSYLERMRRPDGSFRYSARYVTTPVWVTAQALAALSGRSLPLR